MTELTSLGVKDIRDGVRAGDFTAREVAEGFNDAVAQGATVAVGGTMDESDLTIHPMGRATISSLS
jgi:hypothetical protein